MYLMFSENVHFWNDRTLLLHRLIRGNWFRSGTADLPVNGSPDGYSSSP